MDNKQDKVKLKNIKSLQSVLEDPVKMSSLAKEVYNSIDVNGDGYIEISELFDNMVEVANNLNLPKPTMEQVIDIVTIYDNDSDDRISPEEFEVFIREIIENMIDEELNNISQKIGQV